MEKDLYSCYIWKPLQVLGEKNGFHKYLRYFQVNQVQTNNVIIEFNILKRK